MTEIDWAQITSFERHPKLRLPNMGDEVEVIFEDDGNFVPKKRLIDAGVKYPRDSYVFVVSVIKGTKKEKHEFWVGEQSFSTMNQLKQIRNNNGDKLTGIRAKIKRISTEPTETNYEIRTI